MYFSTAVSDPTVQVDPTQLIPGVSAVTVGVPLVSETMAVTLVPAQIGIRAAVDPSAEGLTISPVIVCDTIRLLVGL